MNVPRPMARAGVARAVGCAYLRAVSLRSLLSLLVLLALVLAPAAMLVGAPAMAMSDRAMAGTGHEQVAVAAAHPCHETQASSDRQAPADQQAPGDCCVMTCTAIPAGGGELAVHAIPSPVHLPLPRMRDPHGLAPEADPPPPRFS